MIIERFVEYEHQGVVLEGLLAVDSEQTTPRPAVMVAHAWAGRGAFECDKARQLAQLGYVGFALDLYGKGRLGQSVAENSQLMQPFLEDRDLLQQRLCQALAVVQQQKEVDAQQLAITGYCFGGLCALDLARVSSEIKASVSFHGLLNPPGNHPQKPISAKVLVLHGHDDPMVSPETVLAFQQEMTQAKADWQVHTYGGTLHSFTNPQADDPQLGVKYNAQADQRSWQSLKNFLTEVFTDA